MMNCCLPQPKNHYIIDGRKFGGIVSRREIEYVDVQTCFAALLQWETMKANEETSNYRPLASSLSKQCCIVLDNLTEYSSLPIICNIEWDQYCLRHIMHCH